MYLTDWIKVRFQHPLVNRQVVCWILVMFFSPSLTVQCFCANLLSEDLEQKNQKRTNQLFDSPRVYVRGFQFVGNTVFLDEPLLNLLEEKGYVDRELSSMELEDARRAVTEHYVMHGYLNSGAILEDQDVSDGIVTLTIIEGKLSQIELSGNQWLRSDYINHRVWHHAGPPLNINQLKEGLLVLRSNPNIHQINAELKPGIRPGESILDLHLKERQPFRVALQVDNHRPPSVGSEEIIFLATDHNLTGNSDLLEISYGIARDEQDGFEFSGLDNISGSYTYPINRQDTTLQLFADKSDSIVVEEPFNSLGIESQLVRYGLAVHHPIYRTVNQELRLGISIERSQSETFLLGVPFDLSPGSVNGEAKITVIRLMQEWLDRNQQRVIAARSSFNIGIDAFGVTDDGTRRDARFLSWQGQFQYIQRILNTSNLVLLRTTLQWTESPLLSVEQLNLGGVHTVRGYRENQLVRDRGVLTSIETRLPIVTSKTGHNKVQLAPFLDFGAGWFADGGTPDPKTIASVGIGILLNPTRLINAELYWAYAFRDFDTPEDDPQDLGIHFRVAVGVF